MLYNEKKEKRRGEREVKISTRRKKREGREDILCGHEAADTMTDKGKKVEGDYHEPEFIQIVVTEPQKGRDQKGDFISYKISTSVCTFLCFHLVHILIALIF